MANVRAEGFGAEEIHRFSFLGTYLSLSLSLYFVLAKSLSFIDKSKDDTGRKARAFIGSSSVSRIGDTRESLFNEAYGQPNEAMPSV